MFRTQRTQVFAWIGALALLFVAAGDAFSQEIRRVAEPFQPVRMAHGGYVCEGKLTVSPIDDTYDTVSCSGPIYNTGDYAAVYTKQNHDELAAMNANTRAALNHDLKAAIRGQFQLLPANIRQTAVIQSLEQNILDSIDEKLPEGRGGARPRAPGRPSSGAGSSNPPPGL